MISKVENSTTMTYAESLPGDWPSDSQHCVQIGLSSVGGAGDCSGVFLARRRWCNERLGERLGLDSASLPTY